MKILVVGARQGSLGSALALQFSEGHEVVTAGISGEDWKLDILDSGERGQVLEAVRPQVIVCTVGVNMTAPSDWGSEAFSDVLREVMMVNAVGPLELLREYIDLVRNNLNDTCAYQFIMVSSNSAHIARSDSLPYCASKAALSMGVRVAARETKGHPVVWAAEPGYLESTPMSEETAQEFSGSLHRIPGVHPRGGLDKHEIARMIRALALSVRLGHSALNGCTIRLDGGEQ